MATAELGFTCARADVSYCTPAYFNVKETETPNKKCFTYDTIQITPGALHRCCDFLLKQNR